MKFQWALKDEQEFSGQRSRGRCAGRVTSPSVRDSECKTGSEGTRGENRGEGRKAVCVGFVGSHRARGESFLGCRGAASSAGRGLLRQSCS